MPAYKEKDRNSWTVKIKHKNWNGEIKWVTKRGFTTKRDALQYERDFLSRQSGNLDMSFEDFVKVYREDRMPHLKESTCGMKDNITLFVDEGFGSLDSEALSKAYNTLASLTEGNRLVGIISHVAELKERIDKQIVVTKSKSGGSNADVVIP